MWLIIGLGNYGEKYRQTRHNAGFMALDKIIEGKDDIQKKDWQKDAKRKAKIKKMSFANADVILAKPQTYMNLSGHAVIALMQFYKIPIENLIIIQDDLDLPLGTLRIKKGGGSGGHKGIESIRQMLGSPNFIRIRIGIGNPAWFETGEVHKNYDDAKDYVLHKFTAEELRSLLPPLRQVGVICKTILDNSLTKAMNIFN